MPYDLPLPRKLKLLGWKVKIREKESRETPHVTIILRTEEWRLNLRDGTLMDPPGGSLRDIDTGVMRAIREGWDRLQSEWDERYPENPISSSGANDV